MAIDLKDYESGKPYEGDYDADLAALQERISRLFVNADVHRRKAVIAVEGWDAAGKGGAIQRMTATCDPRTYKVWPISAPTPDEKARHYLWRFWTRVPEAGEVAIFDRTWYGRVLVERVEGFATEAEWRRAYDEINDFEAQLAADGTTIVKLFFHVTQKTQDRRLRDRLKDPWKHWKVGPEDFRNRARRGDYLAAMKDMFGRTNTRVAPWTVIDANHKKTARIAALTHVAKVLEEALPKKAPTIRPELIQIADKALGKGD